MSHFDIDEICSRDSVEVILEKFKKKQTHEVFLGRKEFSEYYHLFPILKKYPDKFKGYMRMSMDTFNYILEKTKKSLTKNWCNFHKRPILEEERLVITIRFLATGHYYSDLSNSFRINKSSVCEIIEEVMHVLWTELYPVHMPVPRPADFIIYADQFYELYGMPHCVGAIDCKHIRIKNPPKSVSKYYNRKHFYSVVLQAVVDARKRFVIIDVGGYGYQHDASTLRSSTFYKAFNEGVIQFPEDDELPDSELILPYFLVGDGAYPISHHLIKPYPGKGLSKEKVRFNKKLSGARQTVECSFGLMCQKWRIYYKAIELWPEKVHLVIKSTCVLHNVIIDLEQTPIEISVENINEVQEVFPRMEDLESQKLVDGYGTEVREVLTNYFSTNQM